MKQNWHKTQVTSNLYVQFMMINIRRLSHINILLITLKTSRINILCQNSNVLLHMIYHLLNITLIVKYNFIMLLLNRRQGIITLGHSPSLLQNILPRVFVLLLEYFFGRISMEKIKININITKRIYHFCESG